MRLLYIFPHPDDESFGPAAAINRQLKTGHEVFLLTLTQGGATRQRFKLGLSVAEMGKLRVEEMKCVELKLGLTGMCIWDYPDSGLAEVDPRELEQAIQEHIEQIRPELVVTYPVHGISGFHDHLVTHAIVKRVYLELRDQGAAYLKRLVFLTLKDSGAPAFGEDGKIRLKHSDEDMIDCIMPLDESDREMLKTCLACYATYQETIEKSGVIEKIGNQLYFEFFQEEFSPPVQSLTEQLK